MTSKTKQAAKTPAKTKKYIPQTFEEACEILGINPQLPDLSTIPYIYKEVVLDAYRAAVLHDALYRLEAWRVGSLSDMNIYSRRTNAFVLPSETEKRVNEYY